MEEPPKKGLSGPAIFGIIFLVLIVLLGIAAAVIAAVENTEQQTEDNKTGTTPTPPKPPTPGNGAVIPNPPVPPALPTPPTEQELKDYSRKILIDSFNAVSVKFSVPGINNLVNSIYSQERCRRSREAIGVCSQEAYQTCYNEAGLTSSAQNPASDALYFNRKTFDVPCVDILKARMFCNGYSNNSNDNGPYNEGGGKRALKMFYTTWVDDWNTPNKFPSGYIQPGECVRINTTGGNTRVRIGPCLNGNNDCPQGASSVYDVDSSPDSLVVAIPVYNYISGAPYTDWYYNVLAIQSSEISYLNFNAASNTSRNVLSTSRYFGYYKFNEQLSGSYENWDGMNTDTYSYTVRFGAGDITTLKSTSVDTFFNFTNIMSKAGNMSLSPVDGSASGFYTLSLNYNTSANRVFPDQSEEAFKTATLTRLFQRYPNGTNVYV